MTEHTSAPPAAKRPRKKARQPSLEGNGSSTAAAIETTDKPLNKTAQVLALLQRPEGASLEQLVAATSWLPHTTRAALTGIKKRGHWLSSEKVDGLRTYRVTISSDAP